MKSKKVKCKKCGKIWEYKGKNVFYASCPDCKRSNKIDDMLVDVKNSSNKILEDTESMFGDIKKETEQNYD